MKKSIMIGLGFIVGVTTGAKIAKLLEMGFDYGLLKLMANNDEFMRFMAVNNPDWIKKVEMLRRK